jgi:hypothetical protein
MYPATAGLSTKDVEARHDDRTVTQPQHRPRVHEQGTACAVLFVVSRRIHFRSTPGLVDHEVDARLIPGIRLLDRDTRQLSHARSKDRVPAPSHSSG